MSSALARTGLELRRAAGEARAGWGVRASVAAAVFGAAAVLPLVTGVFGSLDTLASGLYLGVAAVGLGFAVGIGGIPSLAQGAFVGVGAFTSALAPDRTCTCRSPSRPWSPPWRGWPRGCSSARPPCGCARR